jgi:hypothetical protein
MVMHYQETKSQEHQSILARHKIIEDRKEYLERLNTVRVGTVLHPTVLIPDVCSISSLDCCLYL